MQKTDGRYSTAGKKRSGWLLSGLLSGLLGFVGSLAAEQLPIKTYTMADGLPSAEINRIVRDSRGFLWFCTADGLSLFDGYTFTNYTTDDGLPHRTVNDLLETRGGLYWVATMGGLCRFNPKAAQSLRAPAGGGPRPARGHAGDGARPEPAFVVYPLSEDPRAQQILTLLEDRVGTIWCGTGGGLYRLDPGSGQWTAHWVDLGPPEEAARLAGPNDFTRWKAGAAQALLEDRQGVLWIGTGAGLYRRWPDGRTDYYAMPKEQPPRDDIRTLFEDREGTVWAGTTQGLCRMASHAGPGQAPITRVYTTRDGLPTSWISALCQSSDGKLWVGRVGDAGGLSVFVPTPSGKDAPTFRNYTRAQGLSDRVIEALTEDRYGHLWVGTAAGGVMKIVRDGFTTYTEGDGLKDPLIASIFESRAGDLCVTSGGAGKFLHQFDGRRFHGVEPNRPKPITYLGWGWHQTHFQDHTGEWWVATGQGICRFPKVARWEQLASTHPKAVYTTRDGLLGDNIFRLYEDAHGDIWISNINSPTNQNGPTRWERTTQRFYRYGPADGLPPEAPTAFAEDRAGNLWIGFYLGGLARYRDGHFVVFTAADGLPAGMIRGLFPDHAGRLWVASSRGGVARLDDPTAPRPRFVRYSRRAQDLSSDDTYSITEDQWGRLYIGTGHGVDRLDPATGRLQHYTTAHGLPEGLVQAAFRDRQGTLWFGTLHGLARLNPEPDRPEPPATVLIRRLRIAGLLHPVSELGESAVSGLVLEADQNSVQIGYVGLSWNPGEALRYQYRLEGTGEDWSPPTDQRTYYARLSPGSYRFAVRAVSAQGLVSPTPAVVSFTIRPPVWQRAWFLMLVGLLVASVAYAFYRNRLARLIELERVRTRLAADLHDHIGASLSGISFLSEAAHQQVAPLHPQASEMVKEIAVLARSMAEAISEVVWSIDPRQDNLAALLTRLRQWAAHLLEAQGIAWELHSPPEAERVRLTAEQRRHLFLIGKEALNNIARHAQCTTVRLTVTLTAEQIGLEIQDNGRGFELSDPSATTVGSGHGLRNMTARAVQLGGALAVQTQPGQGTTLRLTVPRR